MDTQRRIVSYLDKHCTAIDNNIAKRRKIVEKLKEYKKSLIAHVVTKGLDPNAEMKDSGIEWIGKVPNGWNVRCLKFLVANVDEPMPEGATLKVPLENVEPWSGKLIDSSLIESNEGCSQGFRSGDVLFSKLRPYLAKVFYAPSPGSCSGEMLVLRSYGINARFLSYVLLSPSAINEIDGLNYGAKMPRANWDIVRNLPIAVPTVEEQEQIVSFLDKRCAAISQAISRQEQIIEKLGEYRKSIIHHAVTGKIDCTEQ